MNNDASERSQPAEAGETRSTITVDSIVVKRDRIICDITVSCEQFRYTTPELASCALASFPTLGDHACVNGAGATFGCVIAHTSLPHLLEHVWIELLVRSSNDSRARFVGTTEWIDEAKGSARVQVSYRDDLQALRTFNETLRFLNIAVLG